MNFKLFSKGKEVTDSVLAAHFLSQPTGVFESLRTYQGKIFRLEDHLKRFLESARTAGVLDQIKIGDLREELLSALHAFTVKNKLSNQADCFLRITWWRFGIYVMAGERKHSQALYDHGVALKTSPVKRSPQHAVSAGAKTTDYVNALMATLEPKQESVYEWIFLDSAGFITEVRIGNFFIVKNGVLLTPPTPGILNGVTRRFVIECAQVLKIPVREIPITRHEVYNADEAFLTNTSWEILPVRELDQRSVGAKIPGPITSQLQQTFKKRVLKECH